MNEIELIRYDDKTIMIDVLYHDFNIEYYYSDNEMMFKSFYIFINGDWSHGISPNEEEMKAIELLKEKVYKIIRFKLMDFRNEKYFKIEGVL